jgi:hypothetical protein
MARPSSFTQEIADEICSRMANGESLRRICQSEHMPPKTTVMQWLLKDAHAAFRDQYQFAREMLHDYWAEDILEIADDTANDTHTTVYEDGAERTSPNTEWISRSKLRVDSRKWLLSKLAAKKYGDRLEVDQKTTHSVDDSVGALLDRVGKRGKRIHDK